MFKNNISHSLMVLAIILIGCGESPETKLHTLFNNVWEEELKESPESATFYGDPRYNDRLTDKSLDAIKSRQDKAKSYLQNLHSIDKAQLSKEDQLNYDLFEKKLKRGIDAQRFKGYLIPVNQMGGVQIDFPNLVEITPFKNKADYENYLKRLHAFPEFMDQTITLMKEGMKAGIIPPKIVLRTINDQIEAQIVPVEESPFYKPFLEFPDEIPDSAQKRLTKSGKETIENSVLASYEKLKAFFVTEYLPSCREEISISEMPNGSEWYKYLVAMYTTTDLTPEEIHDLGLSEVRRIRMEMVRTIKATGFDGSFDEFLEFLRDDSQFYYTNAEDLLTGYRDICKRADPELTKLFGKLPRIPYGVVAIPDYQAPASPTAYYYPASDDGSRPGNFWANTYNLPTRPKYEMVALALHEAVPGHHLQGSIARELKDLPDFRRHGWFTAFGEGWALYAESLGEEMGLYDNLYSKFGQLTYEMWRACRLVVDTGMHALGWARQEAIDFILENAAKSEHDIVVEIDRYIAWPGQALAYKIGELKIKELRKLAKKTLGENFDIREFHDVILGRGSLPLDVLEEQVKAYIVNASQN